MLLRDRASAAVAIAAVAVSTACAFPSAMQPATHRFAKGEHFRYTNVFAVGGGEGVVEIDASKTVSSVDDFEVVDVSASGTMLAHHVEYAGATGFPPTTRYIRVSADGTWRYNDGNIGENVVTWDPVQFGPHTRALGCDSTGTSTSRPPVRAARAASSCASSPWTPRTSCFTPTARKHRHAGAQFASRTCGRRT